MGYVYTHTESSFKCQVDWGNLHTVKLIHSSFLGIKLDEWKVYSSVSNSFPFVLFIMFICVMLLFILWVLLTFSLFFSSLTIIFLGMLLSVFIQLGVLEPYLLSTYYLFASVWVMSIELLSYWLIFYLQCINNLLV